LRLISVLMKKNGALMTTTLRLDWVVLATIALSGWLVSAGSSAQTLTVEGKGTVQIAPEFARMSALVSHTADTAAAAQAAADRVMTRLLAGVDALPVAEDSIDAGQIRIQPRYRWDPRAEMQKFQGYEATRVLSFKLTSLDSLGEALEMLSEQGATTVDAPQYGSAQSPDARARALAIAYAKALADAGTLAEAAGLTLGHPENISTGPQRAPVFRAMNRDAPVAMSAEMAPRYEPGQLSVSASVSVIFTATP
jgi:uncharacterized protein YggE